MNNEPAALRFREETKRGLMKAVRHYTQKRINAEKAAEKLARVRMTSPALVEHAVAVLKFAEEVREEAYRELQEAGNLAIEAGWSEANRILFAEEAEDQQMRGQSGGRRKTRKRSARRKSATRKQKYKRRN